MAEFTTGRARHSKGQGRFSQAGSLARGRYAYGCVAPLSTEGVEAAIST